MAIPIATREDVERALSEGSAQVINVLEPPEGGRLHLIPGSRNIPLSQLEARLGEIDRAHEVITYCAGPACDASAKAAALLIDKGYRARPYGGGLEEWAKAGGSVERAA